MHTRIIASVCRTGVAYKRNHTYDEVFESAAKFRLSIPPMITRLQIQNFKSIEKVSVSLEPMTVLVGRSGSGKSNFLSAIKFLRDVLRANKFAMNEWGPSRPASNRNLLPRFEVEFTIAGIPEAYTYTLELYTWKEPKEEKLERGNDIIFHTRRNVKNQSAKWLCEPKTSSLPKNINSVILGSLPSVPDAVVAFTAIVAGIGCYSFSDAVLSGGPKNDQSFDGLNDTASNYHFVLRDIVSDLHNLSLKHTMVETLRNVNPSVKSVELNDIRNPGSIVVGHAFDGGILALDLGLESDGFRRFYAHLLALYQRPPRQTSFFEHPEDGIHPGALELLANEFKAAYSDGRGQVVLTTHSPKLLDYFEPETIRAVELVELKTKIDRISKAQIEAIHEDLLDAGELLTTDPARILKRHQ